MTTDRPQPQRETRTQAVLAQLRQYSLPPDTAILTWNASYGQYVWNVSQALTIVEGRPRPAYPVSPQLMQQTLGTATVDRTQIAKADPSRHGRVAAYFDVFPRYWRWVVIDGNHRAHKARQTGYPFACYALNPGESWRVLLAYPAAVEAAVYLKHLHCQGNCLRSESPPAPRVPSVRAGNGFPRRVARPGRVMGRRRR